MAGVMQWLNGVFSESDICQLSENNVMANMAQPNGWKLWLNDSALCILAYIQ